MKKKEALASSLATKAGNLLLSTLREAPRDVRLCAISDVISNRRLVKQEPRCRKGRHSGNDYMRSACLFPVKSTVVWSVGGNRSG